MLKPKIPDFVKKYLWDVSENDLSIKNHTVFIIERILEYGDFDSVSWMKKTFPLDRIIKVLKTSNKISTKTGNLYALYFKIAKEEILCIRKPFTQKQNRF